MVKMENSRCMCYMYILGSKNILFSEVWQRYGFVGMEISKLLLADIKMCFLGEKQCRTNINLKNKNINKPNIYFKNSF